MLRRALFAAAALALALAPASAQERVVHVFNWSDYVDPAVLAEFTALTGIKVVYDTYDSNEILETKLLAGRSGYDVAVPSGPFLQRLIRAGAFRKLDRERLPNGRHAWPAVSARLAAFDPGNVHAVNYMWGTTGIGVNTAKVRERLGADPEPSWDLLLKPELSGKLKDCGIHVLDSPEDVLPGVLGALGLDPDSKKPEDLGRAADALAAIRGNVRKFHSSEYINALAGGEICLAVGYSGDILQAKKRADEARNGVGIAFLLPREGALMWFDSFAIPVDAPHPNEAHSFIDYMMRPDVAARNTNFIRFASGVEAAKAGILPEILADPGIYPDEATMRRLFTNTAYDERTQRVVTRLWTRIRTGG